MGAGAADESGHAERGGRFQAAGGKRSNRSSTCVFQRDTGVVFGVFTLSCSFPVASVPGLNGLLPVDECPIF